MFSNNPRFCLPKVDCRRTDDDLPVQDGLALTPSMIGELTNRGIPISEPMAMQFFDGYKNIQDFDPGVVNRRGVDIAEVWEAQKDARSKFRKVHKDAMAAEDAAAAAAAKGGQ